MAGPRLSVVIPVYNVADYLPACLASVQSQGGGELEIIAVDDGSTDSSPAILAAAATADPRISVVTQPNQGLGAARNAGATHATGEFLWFVDSDDLLAPGAVNTLLSTIVATGSDLATGNVRRLAAERTYPTRFLADTFARTRLRTHIRRFSPLIADRVAWNKVFRRSFWDDHDFRFPVGVHYEDQYVTLPAHYLAHRVDVRHEPVYLWRVRDAGSTASITQQRSDVASMRDRVRAVRYVSGFLAGRGLEPERRRYDESAVTHDLRNFLEVFDSADDAYRTKFLTAVNDYLDTVDESAFAQLPAIRRLQWELVRRGEAADLSAALRFERSGPHSAIARRRGRGWYADLGSHAGTSPGRFEEFRVDRELRLVSTVDRLAVDAAQLRVTGTAMVDLVGPVTKQLTLLAIPEGFGRPLRWKTSTSPDGRYEAQMDLGRVRPRRAGGPRRWRLVLVAHDHRLRRIASWHQSVLAVPSSSRTARIAGADATETRLDLTGRGRLTLTAGMIPSRVEQLQISSSGVLEMLGTLGDMDSRPTHLVAVGTVGREFVQPLHTDPDGGRGSFVGRLPLDRLDEGVWQICIAAAGTHHGLLLDSPISGEVSGRVIRVEPGDDGYLAVFVGAEE